MDTGNVDSVLLCNEVSGVRVEYCGFPGWSSALTQSISNSCICAASFRNAGKQFAITLIANTGFPAAAGFRKTACLSYAWHLTPDT